MDGDNTFATLLRHYRLEAGLTQEELAEQAGISPNGLGALERGARRRPQRDTLRLLMEALSLTGPDRLALEAALRPRSMAGPAADSQAGEAPGTREPAARPPVAPHHLLPAPLTRLIGREREVAAVTTLLLREGARLVTLTGPGGVGKTRLALAVAGNVAGEYEHGVCFVSLAQLSDAGQVTSAIASALNVREGANQDPLVTLKSYLQDRELLLVLDNFEHLLPAAGQVHELLVTCRWLTVLVTSRGVLHHSAEHEFAVPPLASPDPENLPAMEALTEYEAVRLFVARARAVQTDFAVTEDNAPAVAQICHRLDGLPLAIELAAARIKFFSPRALMGRLDARLQLLTGGPRDLPERQRTLRDAIAWSHDLLDPSEKTLFRRLAVFSGGCSLEAAASVCESQGDLGGAVFDGLASLAGKNLLRQEEAIGATGEPEPRFSMLETIREFAWEQLAASGETEDLLHRHGCYFRDLAVNLYQVLMSAERDWALELVSLEHDNIHATLRWSIEHHDPQIGLPIIGRLWVWYLNMAPVEGLNFSRRLLSMPESQVRNADRIWGLGGAGICLWSLGQIAQCHEMAEEGLDLARAAGDEEALAMALTGWAASTSDASAVEAAREAREITRRIGAPPMAYAFASWVPAFTLPFHGDVATVRTWLDDALAIGRETNDLWVQAIVRMLQGFMTIGAGELELARGLLTESLGFYRQCSDRLNLAAVLLSLGGISRLSGDLGTAKEELNEALSLSETLSDPGNMAACLVALAGVDLAQGEPERAARLLGGATALREPTGAAALPTSDALNAGVTEAVTAALPQHQFTQLFDDGRRMSQGETVAFAMSGHAPTNDSVANRTFLFSDIVSSTPLVEALGDSAWSQLIGWHDRTLRAAFAEFGGEEVDHAGDGFFVAFADPDSAVACAIAVQRRLQAQRVQNGFAPAVRIGIHATDAMKGGGGYRGRGVHIAARVAAQAGGDEIVSSCATIQSCRRAFQTRNPRQVVLVGVSDPVDIISINWASQP